MDGVLDEECETRKRPLVPCEVVFEFWKALLKIDDDTDDVEVTSEEKRVLNDIISDKLSESEEMNQGNSSYKERELVACELMRDALIFLGVLDIVTIEMDEKTSDPIICTNNGDPEVSGHINGS